MEGKPFDGRETQKRVRTDDAFRPLQRLPASDDKKSLLARGYTRAYMVSLRIVKYQISYGK